MKLTKCFLMALAAVVMLSSCQKDGAQTVESNTKKSVALTIENLVPSSGTRIAGATPSTGTIKVAEIGDLKVLFAADGEVEVIFDLSQLATLTAGNDPAVTEKGTSGSTSTYTFHKLPATIDQVAVTNSETAVVGQTLAQVEAALEALPLSSLQALNLADLANAEYIPVYGEDLAFTTLGEEEHNGIVYDYKASSVKVMPLLARLEISGIECLDLDAFTTTGEGDEAVKKANSRFGSLTLARIGIDNTWTHLTFGENAGALIDYGPIATDTRTVEEDIALFQGDTGNWNVDAFAANTTLTEAANVYTGGTGVFAYNVATPLVPSIILEISGVTKNKYTVDNPVFATPYFVKTASLNETVAVLTEDGEPVLDEETGLPVKEIKTIETFERGHVYKAKFAFKCSDVKVWEKGTLICVDVAVEIPDWVIHEEAVPTFE